MFVHTTPKKKEPLSILKMCMHIYLRGEKISCDRDEMTMNEKIFDFGTEKKM
jgi:hypothetical protein